MSRDGTIACPIMIRGLDLTLALQLHLALTDYHTRALVIESPILGAFQPPTPPRMNRLPMLQMRQMRAHINN